MFAVLCELKEVRGFKKISSNLLEKKIRVCI